MTAKLSYVIEFVSDMDRAVQFYRDTLGLPLKFQSPEWTEFATGDTSLALHPASRDNPAGKREIGFSVEDLRAFHAALQERGVHFPMPPTRQEYGGELAQFVDPEGAP